MSKETKFIAISAAFSVFATITVLAVTIFGAKPISDNLISLISSGVLSICLIVVFLSSKKKDKKQ